MTKFSAPALLLVIFLALTLPSCSQAPIPEPYPLSNSNYNPYPSPDPSYPLPANPQDGAEGSFPVDEPLPTSSTGGTVTGVLLAGDPLEPVFLLPFYLGEVIMLKDGRPGVVSVDKTSSPRALVDKNGRFVFLNVPPGKYSLVLDFVIHTLILRYPDSGEDIYIDVEEGKTVDMGTLEYPELDITPE